ncbi:sugar phosphate isomerase/epimerase [Gracilibacillus salinarum]|uniref:Sugar phosphate isomerase/epimerase n=2 Tax=Gracilibacillus salinarum TaxID=2932255 RepID=A0ABY4GST0_9BACI|nr:sugar phosphate isomerase/epimerase family protein [Gracilibacillus salinarum]UOQ87458.1 sugar phosphate isomerase/epimerase [Gracilibacillus salinarum]
MKFSVFTVMTPDMTPAQLVDNLKEIGYDGVEWRFKLTPEEMKKEQPGFWRNNLSTISPEATDEELDNWLALTDDRGLEVTSITPYLNCGELKETEKVLQVAKKLGASSIRLGVAKYDRTENYNDLFQKQLAYLKEAEQMCKQYNVKGLIETHHQTIAPSAGLAHRIVENFDPDHVGVLYDPANMIKEGYENFRMGMELLGPYLAHVHVKNTKWEIVSKEEDGTYNWQPSWAIVEKGVVDWRQVISDLKAVDYDGNIGMEDFSGELNTKAALEHNIKWIKRLWKKS